MVPKVCLSFIDYLYGNSYFVSNSTRERPSSFSYNLEKSLFYAQNSQMRPLCCYCTHYHAPSYTLWTYSRVSVILKDVYRYPHFTEQSIWVWAFRSRKWRLVTSPEEIADSEAFLSTVDFCCHRLCCLYIYAPYFGNCSFTASVASEHVCINYNAFVVKHIIYALSMATFTVKRVLRIVFGPLAPRVHIMDVEQIL